MIAINEPDVKSLFGEAVEIETVEDRLRFLAARCEHRPALRAEVEDLLNAHDRAGSFLVATSSPRCSSAELPLGTSVGRYKLLEVLGEGGMGIVYRAEQLAPVKRHVALKIIKPGMDSRQVVARFEAERQALALMSHPNIANVLDGGTTNSGLPYFVMEFIAGHPITGYCNQAQLNPRQLLSLFVEVCHAVQHAHQKGIIHRDLKPSNVLIAVHEGRAIPKVIDFGVAKALIPLPLPLGEGRGEGASHTTSTSTKTNHQHSWHSAHAQLIGTPLYMSPEQADLASANIDTRTDVYSLGVILYELLTGTIPFDKQRLHSVPFDELRRILREEEPETISQRLAKIRGLAKSRGLAKIRGHAESHGLAKSRWVGSAHQTPLPLGEGGRRPGEGIPASAPIPQSAIRNPHSNDLDWIVAKCLEKDRSRRYESPSALAADIQRFLADEPVEACPPSRWYRLRKTARKHRASLTAAALVMATIFTGLLVSTWQAVRATRAEQLASANAARAQAQEQKALAAVTSERTAREAEAAQRKLAEEHVLQVEKQRQLLAENQRVSGLVIDEILSVVENPSPSVAARQQDVLTILGKLESVAPEERATAFRRAGELLVAKKQYGSALAAYDAGLTLIPNHRQLLLARADTHFRRGAFAKAVQDYTSAIESEQPVGDSIQVPFVRRGLTQFQIGEVGHALADFKQAHRLAPLPTIKALGSAFEGQYVVSVVPDARILPTILELAEATASKSRQDPTRQVELAVLLVHCGQFSAARAEYESLRTAHEARKNAPFANWPYFSAVLAARAGETEAYRQGCQSMLARYAQATDLTEAVYTLWSCALAPAATDDYTPLIDLARRAHRMAAGEGGMTMSRGAILMRAGQFSEALTFLQKVPGQKTVLGLSTAYNAYLLAMTHHHLGNAEPARTWLAEANRQFSTNSSRPTNWRQRLTLELLQSEATTLITKPATP